MRLYLCPDELPVPKGEQIAQSLNQQAHYAQYRIGSKDSHPANAKWIADEAHPMLSKIGGDNMDVRWPKHCVPGTKGFELIPGLPHPAQYDFFIWKGIEPDMHPYGSCFHDLNEKMSTGIIEFLQSKDVSTVIVGGLTTEYCVKLTALQLLKHGFDVIINLDACKCLDQEKTKVALSQLKKLGAKIIKNTTELIPKKEN